LGDAGRAIAADKPLVQQLVELARSDQGEGKAFAAGLVALEAREFDAADELLLAAASRRPPAKEAVLQRWGLGVMLADQPARAAKVFQRIIDEQAIAGDQATPHYYLAAALALESRTDEALAAARRAAELKPNSAQFAAREGWILYHADRDEAARAAYLELLAKFDSRPGDSETREAVREAKLALSNIDLAGGDYSAAVEWLQQVLDEFPEDVGAGNDLGYLWADRGEHLQRALALIELAVKAEPENSAYRDSLGWVYFRLGRTEDAVRELRKAAEGDDPDGVVLDHLGEALTKSGQPSDAQAAWKRAASAFQKAGDTKKLEAVKKKLTAEP
jgi:tetratricopeptide (TPR) repeat protein